MKITIINTTDYEYQENDFDSKNEYTIINSMQYNIKFCSGCFGCWVKTPGKCVQKDDMSMLLRGIINSDITVFITEIKVGFISSEMKKINDKSIPLLHPYMDIIDGELHHQKRYDKYPDLGLVLIDDDDISDEVFEINSNCFKRFAINFRTKVEFIIRDNAMLGGLKNEINNY